MARPRASMGAGSFPVTVTEDDVRRLCGPSTFHWGDIWQREDHVHEPVVDSGELRAKVLGTFHRVDGVTVSSTAGRMRSSCTCNEGEMCRHAAALLLHWLRKRPSFASARASVYVDDDYLNDLDYLDDLDVELPDAPDVPGVMTPVQEFAQLLEADTMPHLREIARKRGVRVTAHNKAELVERLSKALGEPARIDEALESLNSDERLTLEIMALVRVDERANLTTVSSVYAALKGEPQRPKSVTAAISTLVGLALAFPADRYADASNDYNIPHLVVARLAAGPGDWGPIGRMLPPRDSRQVMREMNRASHHKHGGEEVPDRLGLVELFQVLVRDLRDGRIGVNAPSITAQDTAGVPAGWRKDAVTRTGTDQRGSKLSGQSYVRLLPLPPILSVQDLNYVGKVSAQPARMINFSVLMLAVLGIVELEVGQGEYSVFVTEGRLHDLLDLSPADLSVLLTNVWLSMDDQLELGMVVGADGPLRLNYVQNAYYYGGWSLPRPRGDAVRRVIARVIGRLAAVRPDTWYGFTELLDLLWTVARPLLSPAPTQPATWWFAQASDPKTELKLNQRDDWERVWRPVVETILLGPMTWLGLVDVARAKDEVLAFRPRRRAATLVAQPVEERENPAPVGAFTVHMQDGLPVVFVPSNRSVTVLYSLLYALGEMVSASPSGLSYRLDPQHLQAVFAIGTTGPQILDYLALHGDEQLSEALRPAIEEWWGRYGTVRLYDDLTLIELGDDLLLREILASSTLQDALVHIFSPRVVAVQPAQVDTLIAELTRLGYTPRVAGES